jgi:hypothetical protein
MSMLGAGSRRSWREFVAFFFFLGYFSFAAVDCIILV